MRNLYPFVKRIFDVIFAFVLLILCSPLLVLVAMLIRIEDSNGSIFYTHERGGFKNKPFIILKFRTMMTETAKDGIRLSDSERMLKVGKIIRKLSFDELPQIFNVLKGEMSFIGPRPLSYKYMPFYTYEELHRHDVLPGISGWAQVNGRNNLNWEEKFKFDLFYVDNVSLILDLKIFFMTIKKILMPVDVGVLGKDIQSRPLPYIRKPRVDS